MNHMVITRISSSLDFHLNLLTRHDQRFMIHILTSHWVIPLVIRIILKSGRRRVLSLIKVFAYLRKSGRLLLKNILKIYGKRLYRSIPEYTYYVISYPYPFPFSLINAWELKIFSTKFFNMFQSSKPNHSSLWFSP